MFDYQKLINIVKLKNNKLTLNFEQVDFLDVFEITELMFYITNLQKEFTEYEVIGSSSASNHLSRINFFYLLEKIKENLTPNSLGKLNPDTGTHSYLLELQKYNSKSEFYVNQEKIFNAFKDIKLSDNDTSLLVASLGEIVDNAFFHNLGKWKNNYGPLAVALMQNYNEKKKIGFSFMDYGNGFLPILKKNYSTLQNSTQAIALALQKGKTARPTEQSGGNGLWYLQKNIFNGFRGELFIRSADTLVQVIQQDKIKTLHKNLPYNYGVNVYFRINY
jgi:hypothetical protein